MRDWVTNLSTTHYLVGSAIGPAPFPTIVRDFQSVIGNEIKSQMSELTGRLPDAVIACVGGGSNAIGTFYPFIEDKDVKIVGVEAAGEGELLVILFRRGSNQSDEQEFLLRCRHGFPLCDNLEGYERSLPRSSYLHPSI